MICFMEKIIRRLNKQTGAIEHVKAGDQQSIPECPVDASELAALEGMTRESLIDLFRRVYSAAWGIDGSTVADLIKTSVKPKEELYEAIMLKAATIALGTKDAKEFKELALFWAERERGKAVTPIAVEVRQERDTRKLAGLPIEDIIQMQDRYLRKHGYMIVKMDDHKTIEHQPNG